MLKSNCIFFLFVLIQTLGFTQNSKNIDPNYESLMLKMGLVDISNFDASIRVHLKYSTTDNCVKTDLYGNLTNAYLQIKAAQMLALAQKILKQKYPNYSLLVFDAARPHAIQFLLWRLIDCPEQKKHLYLARPQDGSLHNYGCAVDLTLCDEAGKELDMGTTYDFFGPKAYPMQEQKLLKAGQLSELQIKNRQILRKSMLEAGFEMNKMEWWHFNACARKSAQLKYKIIP